MSNTQLVASLYENMANGDVDAVLDALSDKVEWVNEPKGIHVHGKDELRALWKRQMGAAKVEIVPQRFVDTDKGVLVEIAEKVWNHAGELLFEGPVGHDYIIEESLVLRCDIIDV